MANPTGIGGFKTGETGNLDGRPVGSRNKRTQEIINQIKKLGHKDCLMRLSEIVHSEPDTSLAIAASSALAPYMHSKMQSTPAPRFVEQPITVPNFQTIEEAEAFLATLPVLLGRGEIDSQSALELSQLIRNWIVSKHDSTELELKVAAHGGIGETRITIHGGLPQLPGCENMIMPALNGHDINGEVIATIEGPQTESQQSNPLAQENSDADS